MNYTKIRGKNIAKESKIQVSEILIKDAVEATVFEVDTTGTVAHGKSRTEQTMSRSGIVIKSSNNHKWKLQVSNTGQIVTTDLGEE